MDTCGKNTDHTDAGCQPAAATERCFEKMGKWYKISNAQAAAAAARDCKERERRVAVCALAVAGAFIVDALEKKD